MNRMRVPPEVSGQTIRLLKINIVRMKPQKNEVDNIEKIRRIIFLLTLPLAFIAILIDIFTVEVSRTGLVINLITLVHIGVSFCLFIFNLVKTRINFLVSVYVIIANIVLTNFLVTTDQLSIVYFMRDSLSVFILMALASIVSSKWQNVIIGSIYIAFYATMAVFTHDSFLVENIFWTFAVFGGYAVSMYFYVREAESLALKQEQLRLKIMLKNNELSVQAKDLSEINSLLNRHVIENKQQQLELSKLNATKDKLLSLIAHDLKAPMNSIIGLLELMDKRYNSMPDDKKKYYINLVRGAAINTYSLLENLLEWSISQTTTIKYTPQKLNLRILFNQISELLGTAAQNKNILLNSLVDTDVYVHADEHMIVTVLRNLVSNGIKYTPQGGTVTLAAENFENQVKVSVSDTGIGILLETIDGLFDIDHAVSTKGTSGEKGTGLGLIISNDFLKKHGSRLQVESVPDKGTTFYFSLSQVG
ncbi:MAG: HAMP domain-containing histidine kinase [Bacteroidales bacterium]|nr:HAMP domain-containing histidine kinase [Bacteroidales bacterium]